MKRNIMIATLIAGMFTVMTTDANAQIFRRGGSACAGGSCPIVTSSRSFTRSARSYASAYYAQQSAIVGGYGYGYATAAPSPCMAAQTVVEPCEPCQIVAETVEPCAPVADVPKPCEPVQTTDEPVAPCEPVQTSTETCDQATTSAETCDQQTTVARYTVGACAGGSCPIVAAAKNVTATVAQTTVAAAQSVSMLAQVNALRARYGRAPLRIDARLQYGAEQHSATQARRGQMFHANNGGYEIVAQNNSVGVAEALNQWLQSDGHRAMLLNPGFTVCGVSCERSAAGNFCTIRFN